MDFSLADRMLTRIIVLPMEVPIVMHVPFCGESGTHQNYRPQAISHPRSALGASPTSMQRSEISTMLYLPTGGPKTSWCTFVTLHLVWTISFASHLRTVCLEPFIPVLFVEIPCF